MRNGLNISIKRVFLLCIVNVIITAMFSVCVSAADPGVEHIYTTTLSNGIDSVEEDILINYHDVELKYGDLVKMVFYDGNNEILDMYEIELSENTAMNSEIVFAPETIQGTKHIRVDVISKSASSSGVNVSIFN